MDTQVRGDPHKLTFWSFCCNETDTQVRRGVIISKVRVLTFVCPTISKISNTFGTLTWIPEFCQYPKTLKTFSTFGDLIRTRSHPQIWILMSMHQMCSKFSGTDNIQVSAFHVIRTRNLSIPESWILWHLCVCVYDYTWVTVKLLRLLIKLRNIGDFSRCTSSFKSYKEIDKVLPLQRFPFAPFVDLRTYFLLLLWILHEIKFDLWL